MFWFTPSGISVWLWPYRWNVCIRVYSLPQYTPRSVHGIRPVWNEGCIFKRPQKTVSSELWVISTFAIISLLLNFNIMNAFYSRCGGCSPSGCFTPRERRLHAALGCGVCLWSAAEVAQCLLLGLFCGPKMMMALRLRRLERCGCALVWPSSAALPGSGLTQDHDLLCVFAWCQQRWGSVCSGIVRSTGGGRLSRSLPSPVALAATGPATPRHWSPYLFLRSLLCLEGWGVKTSSLRVNIQSWTIAAFKPEGRANEKRNKEKCWLYSQPGESHAAKGSVSPPRHCGKFQEENGYFFSQARQSVTVIETHSCSANSCRTLAEVEKAEVS